MIDEVARDRERARRANESSREYSINISGPSEERKEVVEEVKEE